MRNFKFIDTGRRSAGPSLDRVAESTGVRPYLTDREAARLKGEARREREATLARLAPRAPAPSPLARALAAAGLA